jgi:hypothetical protein
MQGHDFTTYEKSTTCGVLFIFAVFRHGFSISIVPQHVYRFDTINPAALVS